MRPRDADSSTLDSASLMDVNCCGLAASGGRAREPNALPLRKLQLCAASPRRAGVDFLWFDLDSALPGAPTVFLGPRDRGCRTIAVTATHEKLGRKLWPVLPRGEDRIQRRVRRQGQGLPRS
jgi:hypothetical protein